MEILKLDPWQKKMIQGGKWIDAIKDLRKKNPGASLLHSKEVVDAYVEGLRDGRVAELEGRKEP